MYEIRVEGHLPDRWSDWFEGLAIRNDAGGETTLRGELVDQAALFGVLGRIHALNLVLVSLNREPVQATRRQKSFRGSGAATAAAGSRQAQR